MITGREEDFSTRGKSLIPVIRYVFRYRKEKEIPLLFMRERSKGRRTFSHARLSPSYANGGVFFSVTYDRADRVFCSVTNSCKCHNINWFINFFLSTILHIQCVDPCWYFIKNRKKTKTTGIPVLFPTKEEVEISIFCFRDFWGSHPRRGDIMTKKKNTWRNWPQYVALF